MPPRQCCLGPGVVLRAVHRTDLMLGTTSSERLFALRMRGAAMRVLLVHNRYIQRGGEDAVFAAEAALLRQFGHEVIEFVKDNRDLANRSGLALFRMTIWSKESYRELSELVRSRRPEIVHFHNTLPLISPAGAHAAKAQGAATVQSLHNYRM